MQGIREYILLAGCSIHRHCYGGGAGGRENNYEVVAVMKVEDDSIQL